MADGLSDIVPMKVSSYFIQPSSAWLLIGVMSNGVLFYISEG